MVDCFASEGYAEIMPQLFGRSGSQSGRRLRLPRRRYLALTALTLVALTYVSLAAGVHFSKIVLPGNAVSLPGPVKQLPYLSAPTAAPGHPINFLILGVDNRPDEPGEYDATQQSSTQDGAPDPGLSDTMAVVSVDPAAKTAAVLSIPRDLWLEVPDGQGGWTMDRINEAYHTGEADKLPGGGPAAAEAAVQHNFGIHIDHYLVLNFDGFMRLVDALGGIDLNIPTTITTTILPKANTGGYEYTFLAGQQHLNGELALGYSRFRNDPQGDLGRIQRQQRVALAARQRALSLDWLGHPLDIWNKYNSAFHTDLHIWDMPGFALLGKQIESNAIHTRSLGEAGATTEVILPSGADVLLPDPGVVSSIVGETFNDPSLHDATLARLQQLYPVPGKLTPQALGEATASPTADPDSPSLGAVTSSADATVTPIATP